MRKAERLQAPMKPVKVPKLDFENLVADNMRKGRSADQSDPDLQIIACRIGDMDEDVKVRLSKQVYLSYLLFILYLFKGKPSNGESWGKYHCKGRQ